MILALRVVAVGILLFWVFVAVQLRRRRANPRWRIDAATPVDVPLPRLLAVIPARDEAGNIAGCIASLRASDHPAVDILVFDDASSDGTAELAEAAGVQVRRGRGEALPEGWKGKPWALWRATREIDAPWLAFIDADVRVAPEALSRAHAQALRDEADFFSGFGQLAMVGFWEKVIQPSVGGLILAGNDLEKVNSPKRAEDLVANGQFILVRRDAYEAVGGHGAVRADILDDVGLARAFYQGGFRTRVYHMRELFSCRMYTNLREIWLGWTKNLYAGVHHRPGMIVFLVAMVGTEFLVPYLYVPIGLVVGSTEVVAWGVTMVALVHAVRFWTDGLFGQDRRFGLLQPLGAAMLMGLLIDSARRSRTGAVVWKGRTYAVRREDDTLSRPQ